MTIKIILLFLTQHLIILGFGQTHALTGKVIDHEFNSFYKVSIFNADTLLLGTTDTNGNFSITIHHDIKSLRVATIGMEWKTIELLNGCSDLEIILQPFCTYDFMSSEKVDRLRKKEFKKLPALHRAAFQKGIFKSEKPCYVEKFTSYKKR